MDIETLNSLYSHAGYVTFKEGPNGFPIALITTPHATAAITPYGAHLLSYRFTSDSDDLLFLSEKAIFREGTPIRGGVPVCWPWFGPDPQHLGRSDHGLVRTRMWNVVSSDLLPDQECSITFELTDTPETYALWPHRFCLTLKLTVGKSLTLELTTKNLGDTPVELTQALHTYFNIGDITQTRITGLEGFTYTDKTDDSREKPQKNAIRIDAETDRVYPTDGRDIVIRDETFNRNIRIESKGSNTAVIWNPWIRVCEQKADLNAEDYKKMICVETANAGNDIVTLLPSQHHVLKTVYSIKS
ncbi:D-hexose-6-phosphate mutarotase [Sulfuricurvum sp.]|uniref:D-hexose-6-phosphate mutarotase n=1 Tax=Sulfuricurvum sp. TaxID=2025608 RepID=UPI00262B5077|nr:D-hexose-6-phosphate mutarotase [Sulfuricurvum sp.]MDD2266361.1 D-hexose-6-phosphate mutarotase [Sulfuricurvum sp.]MDD2785104.1 D-hexose-6-phosphate mutarotase [Sulfuricurvum sp.]